jgi:hypothetical protein
MISRRAFVAAVADGVLLTPLAAEAQQPARKISRIGVLFRAEPPADPNVTAFRKALHGLGYVEDRDCGITAMPTGGPTGSPIS